MRRLPEVGADDALFVLDLDAFVHANFYVDARAAGLNFVRKVTRIRAAHHPARMLIACDTGRPSFRLGVSPTYKANRHDHADDAEAAKYAELRARINEQLAIARAGCEKQGVRCVSVDGFEGDDVIASAALWGLEEGLRIVVLGKDKDLFQLVGPSLCVWDGKGPKVVDELFVKEKFGVRPDQMVDWQAMVGDQIDNVTGVRNIGPDTATSILWHFETLSAALESAEGWKPRGRPPTEPGHPFWSRNGRAWSALAGARTAVELARKLVRLRVDVPLGIASLQDLRLPSEVDEENGPDAD